MKKTLTLAICLLSIYGYSQNRYLVVFKDKAGSSFSIDKPLEFLSQKAVDRRTRQKIVVSSQDLPVSNAYLSDMKSKGVKVIYTSRWLNGALIEIPKNKLAEVRALGYVSQILGEFTNGLAGPNARSGTKNLETYDTFDAGTAKNQLQMLGVEEMHALGYSGNGVLIGLLDSGFSNANRLAIFESLFSENRIVETYNFVYNTPSVYDAHSHGTSVLSCVAAKKNGEILGTAPEASFVLYVTEDVRSETRLEEVNWLIAAERADSIGVDIIGSSLGYGDFDGQEQDYSYADLDGNTALISRAADWAAARGILVVLSAGNEGNKAWKYITAPADADSVISVGAVDGNGKYASFSSTGPSFDNRVKPEVAAKGVGTTIGYPSNAVGFGNGTSYAAPLITGLVAGIRQAFPDLPAMEIRRILMESASQVTSPDNLLGYGIPNFTRAYQIARIAELKSNASKPVLVFPNPSGKSERISVLVAQDDAGDTFEVRLMGVEGKIYLEEVVNKKYFDLPLHKETLPSGIYFLKVTNEKLNFTERIFLE